METIKHKIAILTANLQWGDDDDVSRWVYRHISDWTEVSHEDFINLQQGILMNNNKNHSIKLLLIEYPQNPTQILFDTIEEGKIYFQHMENMRKKYEDELREKQERDKKKRQEKKSLRDLKTLEEKKKLLKELEKQIMAEESKK